MAPLSSSWVLGHSFDILLFTSTHKFSNGLRSGEFAGQGSISMLWSSSHLIVDLWVGAKSCWNMKSAHPKISPAGSMKYSRTCWQTSALTLDFRKQSCPTSPVAIAPQTMTDWGNLTLDLMQPGWFSSPGNRHTRGPLFPNVIQNWLSSMKSTFVQRAWSRPILSFCWPDETLLLLSGVQKGAWLLESAAVAHLLQLAVDCCSWNGDTMVPDILWWSQQAVIVSLSGGELPVTFLPTAFPCGNLETVLWEQPAQRFKSKWYKNIRNIVFKKAVLICHSPKHNSGLYFHCVIECKLEYQWYSKYTVSDQAEIPIYGLKPTQK